MDRETLPQAVAAVVAEMQRMMPNATADWCARLTEALVQPVEPTLDVYRITTPVRQLNAAYWGSVA